MIKIVFFSMCVIDVSVETTREDTLHAGKKQRRPHGVVRT